MPDKGKKLLVRVAHEELDLPKFLAHLEEDLVSVSFRKETNGSFRTIYPFTRNLKYIPLSERKRLEAVLLKEYEVPGTYNIQKNVGVLVKAYSVIDNGWRSLYTQNLLHYEIYDQESYAL